MSDDARRILQLVKDARIDPAEGRRRLAELAGRETDEASPPGIAVIGMSCRFSAGDSPEAFWQSLVAGRSSVREIPASRWDVHRYFDPDPREPGKTYSRWGGMLDDVAAFDPLFFQLSGLEAERADPQQRLFLEASWTALEDAGYAGAGVSGSSCGVFAGAPASDYASASERSGVDADARAMMGNDSAILAARISYLLNLRGPSVALNTACSSSLVAVHLACQAIESGQCDMALAGGVCLFVGPGFYLSASKAGMLSPTGQCRAFDNSADGFVPGEGAGVVVLKDLAAALRDGDNVRGVIRGVGTNQDGKTNGMTAPSSRSQTALQLSVYRRAGIDPRSVSLVEAHGTGTRLGDPIEVEALTRSFREYTDETGFCAIGSVKTNIGHTGQAAGVAGLIKCLLALEHEVIPPTLNFEATNERIDFATTPFYPVTTATPWPRRAGSPRRAAVSSYGYSGTNAHLVVEEPPEQPALARLPEPQLVLVSARTDEALDRRLADLGDWLERDAGRQPLSAVAYSLHAGRSHFEKRAGFVAADAADLAGQIDAWRAAAGESPAPCAMAERRRLADDVQRDLAGAGSGLERRKALDRAADAYARGVPIPVEVVFPAGGRRIALPTYPYARERYWHPEADADADVEAALPLRRVADADGHRFHLRPSGTEFYLADHRIADVPVLAAAVSLELARQVGEAAGLRVTAIEDPVWRRRLTVGPDGLEFRLTPDRDGFRFEIDQPGGSDPAVVGRLTGTEPGTVRRVDLAELRGACTRLLDPAEVYRRFHGLGLQHGPGLRALQDLRTDGRRAVADLRVPPEATGDRSLLALHPSLLDGALQTIAALDADGAESLRVPYAAGRVTMHGPLGSACHVRVEPGPDDTLDIDLFDPDGVVLVSVSSLRIVPVPAPTVVVPVEAVWRAAALDSVPDRNPGPLLVCDVDVDRWRGPEGGDPVVLAVPGQDFRKLAADRYQVRPDAAEDFARILADLGPQRRPVRVLVNWVAAEPAGATAPDLRLGFGALLALCRTFSGIAPVSIRVVHPIDGDGPMPHLAALGALARTLRIEDPDLRIQIVGTPALPGPRDMSLLCAVTATDPPELRVSPDGTVHTRELRELSGAALSPAVPVVPGTCWLVTGGGGYLGRNVGNWLAAAGANVVLVGRSPADAADPAEPDGDPRIVYRQADVADPAAMTAAIEQARGLGGLVGIVHAAGVARDSLFVDQDPAATAEILRAKVYGTLVLDDLTREDPIEHLVLFSSLVPAVGNAGQSDYAFANGWLDEFAAYRERLRNGGSRSGRTISIAWPAWSGGGMATRSRAQRPPDQALTVAEGLAALRLALQHDGCYLAFVKGRPNDVRAGLAATAGPPPTQDGRASAATLATAESKLIALLAEYLKVPVGRIDPEAPFERYGIDSIMVTRLSDRLEQHFGPLPKTLFFRYSTARELAGYLAGRPALAGAAGAAQAATPRPTPEERAGDIAVIGLSGRYPMAEDLEQFWHNLREGRDCITEIPAERWPLDGFYDAAGGPGRSYAKWGGFLSDVDRFDPLFFAISPKEADMIDPQERIFLETVWHLLESAGYQRSALAGSTTGVFVGAMYSEYALLGAAPDGRVAVSSHASIANRVSYFFDFRGPSLALDTMCSSSLTAIHLACESLRRGECDTAVAGGVNLSLRPNKYLQLSLARFASTDGRCRSFGADGDGYVPGEGVGALLLKPLAAAVADDDTVHAVIRGSAVNHGGRANGYTVPSPRAQTSAVVAAMRQAGVAPAQLGYVEAHGTGTSLGDPIEVAALTEAYRDLGDVPETIPLGSVKSQVGHLESAAGIAAVTKVILQMRHGTLAPSLHAEKLNPNIDFADSPLRVQREAAPWPRTSGPRYAAVSSFGAGGANAHLVLADHRAPAPDDGPAGTQVLVLSAKTPDRLVELAERMARWLSRHAVGSRQLTEVLGADLLARIRAALDLRESDLSADDPLSECGLDRAGRVRIGTELGAAYRVPLDELPEGVDSVTALTRHLVAAFQPALREHFGVGRADGIGEQQLTGLADIAYSLQLGREEMPERLAVVASEAQEAVRLLHCFVAGGQADGVSRGRAGDQAGMPAAGSNPDPAAAARDWVTGLPVDWAQLHLGAARRRVPLVGYPFARQRHWLDTDPVAPRPTSYDETEELVEKTEEIAVDPDVRATLLGDLVAMTAEIAGLSPDGIDVTAGLGDYGLESVAVKQLAEQIGERYALAFSPTLFYERRGLAGVADWLIEEHADRVNAGIRRPAAGPVASVAIRQPALALPAATPGGAAEPIAIIGMNGRFPGSPDLDRYWANLVAGRDLVTEVPADRWDWRAQCEDLPEDQHGRFRWGGFLDDVDAFDPLFFGIAPAEAQVMDPQQRLLLETVWHAIEDAGYRPSQLAGADVGLFAGVQFSDYQHLLHEAGVLNAQAGLGNEHSIAVNRISFLLDLRGPSEPVNTACSSSLVAVHRAVRSIRNGESTIAIAAGIALNLAPYSTVAAAMMGLLSPDGRCKTLDRSANGYVKGEGVGAIVLKPLRQAVADGDQIHAVIRGTGVNHGGRAASITAPSSDAQAALIRDAMMEAGVGPESIGYLELHGTGTELGDPVEINGIRSAFRQVAKLREVSLPKTPYCAVGSVKTNIGHLEPASGIAGLIKVVLSMRHQTLPQTVHLQDLNPYADLAGSPFRPVREREPWHRILDGEGRPLPLRGGVSSFGFGGVNAHVMIEEYPAGTSADREVREEHVFVVSARTPHALDVMTDQLIATLDRWQDMPDQQPTAGDVAFTLHFGREEWPERLAVVAADLRQLHERLAAARRGEFGPEVHRGQGSAISEQDAVAGAARERAAAWVDGRRVVWPTGPARCRRVSLPGYPFERQRYWFSAPETATRPAIAQAGEEMLTGEEYIRAVLRDILLDKLKLTEDQFDESRPLQDFGVDSILGALIVQVAQEEFAIQLPVTALVEYPTLRALSSYIHTQFFAGREEELTSPRRRERDRREDPDRLPPELIPINVTGNRQPSFWVHGAAGYAAWFQDLSHVLGPDYPIYAFQARGTDGHSMPQTLEEMVDHYVACIRKVQPHGPYVIGGYSFGGIPAMEIARRLQEQGETIRHLIMFDTYPATQKVFDEHHGGYDDGFLQFYLANYFLNLDENPQLAIRPDDVAHLPASLRVAELARLAKERSGKLLEVDDVFRYLRGGLECSAHAEGIYQLYKMRPYDASDVLFFRAMDGFTGRSSKLYWAPRNILGSYDYVRPWQDIVAGEVAVVELDNDHLSLLSEPTMTTAAKHIEAVLREPPPMDTERYQNFVESFDALTEFGTSLLARRLRDAGVMPLDGTPVSLADLGSALGVQQQFDRLFQACVDLLERAGLLRRADDAVAVTEKMLVAAPSDEQADRAAGELVAAHSEIRDYVPLLLTCQAAVLEVIRGDREATDVLFPGGSMELVAELYKGNIQTEYYNRVVAERVEEHVRHFGVRYPHGTAQVFEVGAGTGGTSAFVLPPLAGRGRGVRYFYTDVGAVFVQMAKPQFAADYPFAEFLAYDIERSPSAQGFEPHSMDVVVASNVLHTTHRMDVTLAQCRSLLKPDGVLVINEMTRRLDYNTLTFGLTTGWWLYEDEEIRVSGCPLLDTGQWRRSLLAAGFAEPEFHGLPGVARDDHAQCVIVARATE